MLSKITAGVVLGLFLAVLGCSSSNSDDPCEKLCDAKCSKTKERCLSECAAELPVKAEVCAPNRRAVTECLQPTFICDFDALGSLPCVGDYEALVRCNKVNDPSTDAGTD